MKLERAVYSCQTETLEPKEKREIQVKHGTLELDAEYMFTPQDQKWGGMFVTQVVERGRINTISLENRLDQPWIIQKGSKLGIWSRETHINSISYSPSLFCISGHKF